MSAGKIEKVDYSVYASYDNTEKLLFELTMAQAIALIVQAKYLGWSTRWEGAPTGLDFSKISEDIVAQLLTPVACEVNNMILRWSDCVLQYSMNEGVTWQNVTGYDGNCFVNSDELAGVQNSLQAQITANSLEIDDVSDSLTSLISVVGSNSQQITVLNTYASDHETRIQNLENQVPVESGGSGLWKEISITRIDNPAIVIPVSWSGDWRVIKIEFFGGVVAGVTAWLNVALNGDTVGTNYESSIVQSTNVMGYVNYGLAEGVEKSYCDVTILNSGATENKVIMTNWSYQYGSTYGTTRGSGANRWLNSASVSSAELSLSGGNSFTAGSYVRVSGIPESSLDIDAPELPTGQERIVVTFDSGGYENYILYTADGYPVIGAGEFGQGLQGYLNKTTQEGATGIDIVLPSNQQVNYIQFSLKTAFLSDFSGFTATSENYKIIRVNSSGEQIETLVSINQVSGGHGFEKRFYSPDPAIPSTHTIRLNTTFFTDPNSSFGEFTSGIDNIVIDYTPV
jgi:hypothetical protein